MSAVNIPTALVSRPSDRRRYEPQHEVALPDPPDGLDAEELAKWKSLAARVLGSRIISEDDEEGLEALARTYVRVRRLERQIKKEGFTIRTTYGNIKANPACRILRDQSIQLRSWLAHFGLTPASRATVQAAPRGQDPRASVLGDAEFTAKKVTTVDRRGRRP